MSHKPRTARDPFTFSLGGMTTIASFVPAPAVADHRIGRTRPQQKQSACEVHDADAKRQENAYSSAA